LPKITWKLPVGWTENGPGPMSLVNFGIESGGGKATVAISPLPDMSGKEAVVVNISRQKAGAPELKDEEAEAALKPVELADGSGKMFEITTEFQGKPTQIVTAIFNRGSNSWFFKLQGDAAVVEAQKPVFLEFLKSIQFEEKAVAAITNPPPPPDASATATAESGKPAFQAPEGWRTLIAGQMQVAKFAVPMQGEETAQVTVSVFPNDTGGPVANIARWRRQLGMPDVPAPEVGALIKPIEGVEDGIYADLQHEKRRLIGAIVHRGDQWWFYKLMGDEAAVAAARESFLNFAKSQPKS
jgi:hypothetical protein